MDEEQNQIDFYQKTQNFKWFFLTGSRNSRTFGLESDIWSFESDIWFIELNIWSFEPGTSKEVDRRKKNSWF